MHKGQRVAFSLCPCASSLKYPNPQVVVVLAPATPTAPVALSLSPVLLLLFLPVLSLPQLQLANYEKRNLITTANEQMQLAAHAAACNMQQLATCSVRCVCVCCVCLVFVSNFMAQRRIRNEIDRQLQLPQNIRCASNAPRHVALFAQRRPTQFINAHTHTHTCIGLPQGSLGGGRPN